jgi:hypothetical protein
MGVMTVAAFPVPAVAVGVRESGVGVERAGLGRAGGIGIEGSIHGRER